MTYRAALTYHPDIGTFRGQRGAWRVFSCWERPAHHPSGIEVGKFLTSEDVQQRCLFMDVPRKLVRHTFVNPTKLLRELLAKRRGITSSTTKE